MSKCKKCKYFIFEEFTATCCDEYGYRPKITYFPFGRKEKCASFEKRKGDKNMGWLWIALGLIAISIVCLILFCMDVTPDWVNEIISYFVATMFVAGIAMGVIFGLMTFSCNVSSENNRLNVINEREALVSLYEKYDYVSNKDVTASMSYYGITDKILSFNKNLRTQNKWSKDPIWGSLFYNNLQDIEEISFK